MSNAIRNSQLAQPDYWLPTAVIALLALGLVMVCSASITIAERELNQPFYYLLRQLAYVGAGLLLAYAVLRTRLVVWEKSAPLLLLFGILLLTLVIMPGIGRQVNGSMRWLGLGFANLQPSELIKLLVIIYMAGYLVRQGEAVRSSLHGFLKPLGILVLIAVLLLLEPDFGATVVILATALGMLFLGGARLWQFGLLIILALVSLAGLALASPYRLERLTTFLNPWADPFNSGFQLTQALIAFGRGEWFGVGLGGSIQKLFYLPEAHTDFLFAVLAEELGLAGAIVVIGLFTVVVWRAFAIGHLAEQTGNRFAAFIAYGLGIWLALQAFFNIGVNMGMLPTKGLTLPLMSYGGSSIVMSCVSIGLLMRVDYEVRQRHNSVDRRAAPRALTAMADRRAYVPAHIRAGMRQ
ncbi:MAG: putative lipid II flippase FtsW [Gammaproteobacteria bacterium]